MHEDYQNPELSKATVQIESELYHRVSKAFHYGQLSSFLREVFISTDKMIKAGDIMKIVGFIHGKNDLILKTTPEPEPESSDE